MASVVQLLELVLKLLELGLQLHELGLQLLELGLQLHELGFHLLEPAVVAPSFSGHGDVDRVSCGSLVYLVL